MASAPMEVLKNISLLVDGRVCGFGIIEPFVLANINTLNIEIREGMALKNDAQLSNVLQPPSRSNKVFKYKPTPRTKGKQNQEAQSSTGVQTEFITKKRCPEEGSSSVMEQPGSSSNTNNHSADRKEAKEKSSGTVRPGGGNNEPNSHKIMENSGKLWTSDFEKHIQHSSTPKVVFSSKQSIKTNLNSINRKQQIQSAGKPNPPRPSSSTKENCAPKIPSSLASTEKRGTQEGPGTGLKSAENSLSRTTRKRRPSSCSENTEKNYTPNASSMISTTKEPVTVTASTIDRPGSSTSRREIGTTSRPSFNLATAEKKITLKEHDSKKGTTFTPKRQSYDLVSIVNESTPKGESFASTEKKVTFCTPRTRKSSACKENLKKSTPCTPTRTSPRFTCTGNKQTDSKISGQEESKQRLSEIHVNKIDTSRKSSPKVSLPNKDKKKNVKTDLLDTDEIIFVNDSLEFDYEQSSQDEGQIDNEIQKKEGDSDPLSKRADDPVDLSSNSESNDSVTEVTENMADDDSISNQEKKNVVESTVGFFMLASKSNTPSPMKEYRN